MAKEEEKLIADILNNTIDDTQKRHRLFPIAKEWAEEIKKDIKNINKCHHIGNSYAERGDIMAFTRKKQYIELKLITQSKTNKGTLANTSQNILREYNLIKDALGWQEWRERKHYKEKVMAFLNKETNYTNKQRGEILKTESIIDPRSEIEIKARILRLKIKKFAQKNNIDFRALPNFIEKLENNQFDKDYLSLMDSETKKALNICKAIIMLARKDLRGYIEDCSKGELNKKQFLKFIILLKSGFHTIPLISSHIDLPLKEIKNLTDNYWVYYYYTKRNVGDRIKKETPNRIKKCFPSNLSHLRIIFDNESLWIFNKEEKIMQLKFHWRNVFFGIAVPSVEIFDRSINHI